MEKLLAKIESDAREEGKRVVNEARQEAERIKQEAKREARETAESIMRSYRERGERQRTRIMSEALAESRTAFLEAQDGLFEEAFDEAISAFENLPEERYRAWLKRLILENISSGKEKIMAAAYDRRLLEDGLLDEINREIEAGGGNGSLSLERKDAGFKRGIMLKSRDFINNLSIDSLMREVRDRHEEEVLKMLFGEVDVRGPAR
jgi:V/A-type H+-transporting ATPase subunit E